MSLRNFSSEELSLIEKIKKTGLNSHLGSLRMLAFLPGLILVMGIAMYCQSHDISFGGFGDELSMLSLAGFMFLSFREMYLMSKYKDQFIDAWAKRIGFEVIEHHSTFVEGDYPQVLDPATKTYYRIYVSDRGVRIEESRNL